MDAWINAPSSVGFNFIAQNLCTRLATVINETVPNSQFVSGPNSWCTAVIPNTNGDPYIQYRLTVGLTGDEAKALVSDMLLRQWVRRAGVPCGSNLYLQLESGSMPYLSDVTGGKQTAWPTQRPFYFVYKFGSGTSAW